MTKTTTEYAKILCAWSYTTQMRMVSWCLQRIPVELVQKVGSVFRDEEVLAAANHMHKNMTFLPAFPGTVRYKHNLTYTQPFVELLQNKVEKALG